MGAGDGATAEVMTLAEELGEAVARRGWVVLTGGRDLGVMLAAARGAKRVDGSLSVGILPGSAGGASQFLDVAIFTGLGEGRNVVNVLSSDVVVACGPGGPGTASEAAFALVAGKPLILLSPHPQAPAFYAALGKPFQIANSVPEALTLIALSLEG